MYIVAMTITTVGYGDITADNTSERVGYTVFFIVCAFFWAELLAEVTVITQIREEASRETLATIQGTLDFLLEIDCPSQLRIDIIKWTRFNLQQATHIAQKKNLIAKIPADLQRGLLHHLYTEEVCCASSARSLFFGICVLESVFQKAFLLIRNCS
jgi:hypothetical protein